MRAFDPSVLTSLYTPPSDAHKSQNGSVLLIGGSELFHAASLWSLQTASRIVDMVFYSSVEVNNEIVKEIKKEFRNGIIVPRDKIKSYIEEADVVLIGPGLPRPEGQEKGDSDTKGLTESLLRAYPRKKWVIDGGSLQVVDPDALLSLSVMPILTPHTREFEILKSKIKNENLRTKLEKSDIGEQAALFAQEYKCIVLLKGKIDYVCSPDDCVSVEGGNSGMTKGGTGDVLAGLVAALYAKNEAYLSACAASFINKKAGDNLFQRVGYYFNASDLADEVPRVMKEFIVQ